jgi:hypothetical protein
MRIQLQTRSPPKSPLLSQSSLRRARLIPRNNNALSLIRQIVIKLLEQVEGDRRQPEFMVEAEPVVEEGVEGGLEEGFGVENPADVLLGVVLVHH